MGYNYAYFKCIIDESYNSFARFNSECIDYARNVNKDNFESYKDVLSKRGESLEFNFFDVLSHKWRHENFHSDMLKLLLEKYPDFLRVFLETVNTIDKKNNNIDIEYYKECEIKCELPCEWEGKQGRIDVAIIGKNNGENDKKHAVIIENKINWAGDQDVQLYRYYKGIEKTGYEVDKIVYLTPSKYKTVSDDSLGCAIDKSEYENIKNNKLVNLIGFDGNENDLVSCLEKIKIDKIVGDMKEDYRVFLRHYIEILKRTGVGDMSVIASKFLEEIKESAKKDENIGEKLAYMKEMFDNLPEARVKYWVEKTKGANYKNYICYKEYKTIDVTYYWDIYTDSLSHTIILINNREQSEEHQKKLEKIFKKNNISIELDGDGFFRKEFKFPSEDDEVLECVKKIDTILTGLQK